MSDFAKGGQRLQSPEFPRNVFQYNGDVVILDTTFRLVLVAADGKSEETRGRGTEFFVLEILPPRLLRASYGAPDPPGAETCSQTPP